MAPLMARARSEARKTMASATAAGVVQRFGSTFGMSRRFWGVSMVSGSTALTRIRPPSSAASASVRRATAAFEAA